VRRPCACPAVIGVAIVLTALSPSARTCVLNSPKHAVGPNFVVTVVGPGSEGLRMTLVELAGLSEGVSGVDVKTFTDKTGRAEFPGVKAGDYFLTAQRNQIEADFADVHVGQGGEREFTLKWRA
jgi:hypothetical protein